MVDEPTVVLVVPIVPAATGNGLAMRAGMLLDALAPVAEVHVVVVPVSGGSDDPSWAEARARSVTVVDPVAPDAAREHTTRQLSDVELRDRLALTAPLPARATLAPPTLATEVAAALSSGVGQPAAVLAMRLYLTPLGIRLARQLNAARVVVDADDDDGALLRSLGEASEAAAYDRLAACWLPDADAVLAASADVAQAIAARAGLARVDVVPNVVAVPTRVSPPPASDRLLFVGNLTYAPNRVAARVLAREVLPLVREHLHSATLELVGPNGGSLDDLAGIEGVRVTGAVPDITPHYASADVVVVPLLHGSGTRIKVLEACAHRRPVVATSVAVAGLDLEPDRDVVIAESTREIADAVDEVLADPARAASMVERAADVVATRHTLAAVAPLVRAAVLPGVGLVGSAAE